MELAGHVVGDRYRLLALAGRGGMAQVWAAEALGAGGARVAVKRMLPAMAADDGARAMFADEARITAGFDHPNIVRCEGWGADARGPYIALEWIDGVTLRDLMNHWECVPPIGVVLAVALDVLRGLASAHGAAGEGRRRGSPVFHRDISPENVLVTTGGVAKLADFGLARSLAHPRTRGASRLRGKIAYMPPEVLAGRPHGARGDVYSLGVVLWEALAGRDLYPDEVRDARTARAMLVAPRMPLALARPDVPPAIAAAVDRALAVDPAARHPSAPAMAFELLAAAGAAGLCARRGEVVREVRDVESAREWEAGNAVVMQSDDVPGGASLLWTARVAPSITAALSAGDRDSAATR